MVSINWFEFFFLKFIYSLTLKIRTKMNKIIFSISFIVFNFLILIEFSNAQSSVCAYENNVDYVSSVDITYVYAKAPAYCCSL